ncbi:MAG TPA: hypothetical protein VKQ32_09635 [Polyangia bacterium]|nr:hypothetical protein [Polyangia bacterium]
MTGRVVGACRGADRTPVNRSRDAWVREHRSAWTAARVFRGPLTAPCASCSYDRRMLSGIACGWCGAEDWRGVQAGPAIGPAIGQVRPAARRRGRRVAAVVGVVLVLGAASGCSAVEPHGGLFSRAELRCLIGEARTLAALAQRTATQQRRLAAVNACFEADMRARDGTRAPWGSAIGMLSGCRARCIARRARAGVPRGAGTGTDRAN